jgi:hypothetical protein
MTQHNLAYVSFSVFVCPSVLTMIFLAPCADSAPPPGMLICHAVLLSLLKKSGKVFVTLFPRFPPPWPALLRHQVFDAIKIAMSLVVCFLQRQFHHRWQSHGTAFLMKIEPESPRSSAGVLSLNTPAVPHQIQAIMTILEWKPAMVDTVLLIIWLVYFCFNEELSLLPKNPTEAKLQATSTRGESTEPT